METHHAGLIDVLDSVVERVRLTAGIGWFVAALLAAAPVESGADEKPLSRIAFGSCANQDRPQRPIGSCERLSFGRCLFHHTGRRFIGHASLLIGNDSQPGDALRQDVGEPAFISPFHQVRQYGSMATGSREVGRRRALMAP